jgi:WD40 repeat protein
LCRGLAFHPNGKVLATASTVEKEIWLWDIARGERTHRLVGHSGYVMGSLFSPDGKCLASVSFDRSVRIWSLEGDEQVAQRLCGHLNWVNGEVFTPDGKRLATAGFDGRVIVWDVVRGTIDFHLSTGGGAYGVDIHPDGERLVTSTENGSIQMWSITPVGRGEISVHPAEPGYLLAWPGEAAVDGMIELSSNGRIKQRDWENLKPEVVFEFKEEFHGVVDVAVDRGIRRVAANRQGRTKVWERLSGKVLIDTGESKHKVNGLRPSFSPDGRFLVTDSQDGGVEIWDVGRGVRLTHLPTQPILGKTCFSPNGEILAVSRNENWRGGGGEVWLWRLELDGRPSGEACHFQADFRGVNGLSFSPDGRRLAVCGMDSHPEIWDAGSGERIGFLRGHTSRVESVRYSPDGKYLVSCGWDRTVKIWDGGSLAELLSYTLPTAGMISLAVFTPNGREIIVCCEGTYLRLVFQDGERLLKIARQRITSKWQAGEDRYLHPAVMVKNSL